MYVFLDQYSNLIFKNNIINLGVIYRNYESKNRHTELLKIANACKKKKYKLYVSNDIKLALKVKADGIYIPSFNKTKGFNNLGKKNLKILGSAHNQKEIKDKIRQNCYAIFLAPTLSPPEAKIQFPNLVLSNIQVVRAVTNIHHNIEAGIPSAIGEPSGSV